MWKILELCSLLFIIFPENITAKSAKTRLKHWALNGNFAGQRQLLINFFMLMSDEFFICEISEN